MLMPQRFGRAISAELAFRMRKSLPEVPRFDTETEATQRLYGLDDPRTRQMGGWCPAARRMVERGARFVQVCDGPRNDGGGGIRGGVVHGATDEPGYHAVEDRHYVTDIHATVPHLLGLDPRRLVVPGRKRLEIDFGKPITEVLA